MSLAALLLGLPWGSLLGGAAALYQRHQEHRQRVELLRLEREGQIEAGRSAAFTASQHAAAAESADGVWVWVKSLRYGTRFLLTWLVILSAVVVSFLPDPGPLAPKLFSLADLAFGWWFGTRPSSPSPLPASQSTK